jgi:hypothetical protein
MPVTRTQKTITSGHGTAAMRGVDCSHGVVACFRHNQLAQAAAQHTVLVLVTAWSNHCTLSCRRASARSGPSLATVMLLRARQGPNNTQSDRNKLLTQISSTHETVKERRAFQIRLSGLTQASHDNPSTHMHSPPLLLARRKGRVLHMIHLVDLASGQTNNGP